MKTKTVLRDISLWLLGSAAFSVSVNVFSAPNGIMQGGLTGIATVINHFLPAVPIGTAIFMMNVPLFFIAWRRLKSTFIIKTVCATVVFTSVIDIGAVLLAPYKGDTLSGCIFCGLLSGLGLALIFMTGATTGGTDIVAMLTRKKFPALSMGRVILLTDFAVVLLSFFVYGQAQSVFYGIIVIFLSSKVIDTVLID